MGSILESGKLFPLTLKAPVTAAADDIHKYFFHCFSEKIRPDNTCEFSAGQRIQDSHEISSLICFKR